MDDATAWFYADKKRLGLSAEEYERRFGIHLANGVGEHRISAHETPISNLTMSEQRRVENAEATGDWPVASDCERD